MLSYIRALLLPVCVSVIAITGNAQEGEKPATASDPRFSLTAAYQDLYSTHRDHFRGAHIIVSKPAGRRFHLGLGIEYTAAPLHPDNGWVLTGLRFIPVFADAKMELPVSRSFITFAQLSAGISFNSYMKDEQLPGKSAYKVKEQGFFAAAGLGLGYKITSSLLVSGTFGGKAYRITNNNLDVNPHGIAYSLGLRWDVWCRKSGR